MDKKQTFTITHNSQIVSGTPNYRELHVRTSDVSPHWVRCGPGSNYVRFGISAGKWVSIDATEYSFDHLDPRKLKSSKRTMVTLNEDAARALYRELRLQFDMDDKPDEPGAL